VALAAQGWRNLDDGNEKIMDESFNHLISGKVKKITLNSLLTGLILTALAFSLAS